MSSRRILVKNAAVNVLGGGVNALFAILVPLVLTRVLAAEAFATWSLVVQLAAYTAILGFGIQTAVGRFVAFTSERGDAAGRDEMVSTALVILSGLALLAALLVLVFSWQLPRWFSDIPLGLVDEARLALVIVGFSLALALPASVPGGVFFGLQRNEYPALLASLNKLVATAAMMLTAFLTRDLIIMAVAVAVVNLVTFVAQFALCRKLVPYLRYSPRLVTRRSVRELVAFCSSLAIWTLGGLLISGLDLILVGHFDFPALAAYAAVSMLVNLIPSLFNALFSPLIAASSQLVARREAGRLGNLLMASTRYATLIMVMFATPLVLYAGPLLRLWLGDDYARDGATVLQLLAIGYALRWCLAPYGSMLVGTGEQRLVIIAPLLEGVVNLAASIVLGSYLGATGVALGTVIGSVVAVLSHFLISMPRTVRIRVDRLGLLLHGNAMPLLCALPLVAVRWLAGESLTFGLIGVALMVLCAFLVGLSSEDRRHAQRFIVGVLRK